MATGRPTQGSEQIDLDAFAGAATASADEIVLRLRPRVRRGSGPRPRPGRQRRAQRPGRDGGPRSVRRPLFAVARAPGSRPRRRAGDRHVVTRVLQHVPALARRRARRTPVMVRRSAVAGAGPLRHRRARSVRRTRGVAAADLRRPAATRRPDPRRHGVARPAGVAHPRTPRNARPADRGDPPSSSVDRQHVADGPLQPLRPTGDRGRSQRRVGDDASTRGRVGALARPHRIRRVRRARPARGAARCRWGRSSRRADSSPTPRRRAHCSRCSPAGTTGSGHSAR